MVDDSSSGAEFSDEIELFTENNRMASIELLLLLRMSVSVVSGRVQLLHFDQLFNQSLSNVKQQTKKFFTRCWHGSRVLCTLFFIFCTCSLRVFFAIIKTLLCGGLELFSSNQSGLGFPFLQHFKHASTLL